MELVSSSGRALLATVAQKYVFGYMMYQIHCSMCQSWQLRLRQDRKRAAEHCSGVIWL